MHSIQQRPAQSKANSCLLRSTAKDTNAELCLPATILRCSDNTLGKLTVIHCTSAQRQPHMAFINVPDLQ